MVMCRQNRNNLFFGKNNRDGLTTSKIMEVK